MDWLARRTERSPDRIGLIDGASGARVTYRAWNAVANQTAGLLRALGVGRGDRVALLARNAVAYLDVVFACDKLGAIAQHLNWRLTAPELEPLLAAATPRVLVYGGDEVALIRELQGRHATIAAWVALGESARPSDVGLGAREGHATTFGSAHPRGPGDAWMICYTGGSTGVPKGAVLTQSNVLWNAINTVVGWALRPDDVAILAAPLFHAGGLNVFTLPLVYAGGASIVCARFDPDAVFDIVARGDATLLFGVPTMFAMLQDHPRWAGADFSRMRIVISGGAAAPPVLFERFWAKGVAFKTGYGLTEAGPNTFWLPDEDVRKKPGSVGFPLPHVEVKLVDASGSEVAEPERPGELLVRGPHVMHGYWNDPRATGQAIDAEGWLHTGDVARRDRDGAFTINGRIKDMYVSGGENVYPAEVEEALSRHADVAEVAVISFPDPRWGEVGRAFVSLRTGSRLAEADLLAFLRGHLAGYKHPKAVRFLDVLPKTGAGKIDKLALRALLRGPIESG